MRTRPRTSRWTTLVAALLLATSLAGCGNEADGEEGSGEGSGAGSGEDVPTVECEYPEDGSAASREVEPPPAEAPESGSASVTVSLNAGEVTIDLAQDTAPCTVSAFLSLAEQGFYDETPCHRLTTENIFVLQCGDPTGTGMGGPGYRYAEELSGEETYEAGVVAMAKAAAPSTTGSQFFLNFQDSPLPPEYTVLGTMDPASLEVLTEIAAQGTSTGTPDGPPKEPVTIKSVSVDSGG